MTFAPYREYLSDIPAAIQIHRQAMEKAPTENTLLLILIN